MIAGLFLAAAAVAQSAGPPAPAPAAPAKPAAPVEVATKDCSPAAPNPNSREVVVCVQKPQGFRIDPDVMAAKKAKRQALAGRLKTPQEKLKDRSCTVVGPQGCTFDQPGINLLAAAATVAEISQRLAKGEEIGSIFVTDPQMTEYQYYQEAKKEREAKESEAAIKAYAAKAKAKAAAEAAASAQPQSTP